MFDLAELDRVLTGGTLHADAVEVLRAGRKLAPDAYRQIVADRAGEQHAGRAFPFSSIHPGRLLACFESGASIRVRRIDAYSAPARELALELETSLGCAVELTAVLSPKDAAARAPERIVHDLRIIAIAGAAIVTVDDRMFRAEAGRGVEAPAGATVEVVAIEPFLGLEAILRRTRAIDLLRAAVFELCARALTEEPAARRAVSIEPKSDRFGSNDWLAETAAAFAREPSVERALERLALDRAASSARTRIGGLAQIRAAEQLPLDASVSIPGELFFVLSELGAELKLSYQQKRITFPARARTALRWLCERRRTKVASLPGLEDDERLVLAQRLVREGFLVIDA